MADVKEHGYADETRRFLPMGLSGLAAASGMEATNSKVIQSALSKRGLGSVSRFARSGVGSAAVPIALGSTAYAATKKATGGKMDDTSKATMIGSAGGVTGAALYERFKKGVRSNQIKRSGIATAGALLSGLGSVAFLKSKRKTEEKR